jgi:hypothetical protein
MNKYRLLTTVVTDVGALPLRLASADQITSGGFLVPKRGDPRLVNNSAYAYSMIDLTVAGLEAVRLNIEVSSLPAFFDKYHVRIADTWVKLAVIDTENNYLMAYTIAEYMILIQADKDEALLHVLHKNAPWTFKWVTV